MEESFIHYIWLTGSFRSNNLHSTNNQPITIIKRGNPHTDSGPDFMHAQIRIADQLWAGHVEIHVKSSEWFEHKHQFDLAYDNTILHVCYEFDVDVFRTNGSLIPCLELKSVIHPNMYRQYKNLIESGGNLPCERVISEISSTKKLFALEQMMALRYETKSKLLIQEAEHLKYNWNELFYRQLCGAFGLRVNHEPFKMLCRLLPFNLVAKYSNKPFQLEALLFGTAGFLSSTSVSRDEYELELSREYQFLRNKYNLQPMELHLWKFLRLRPANFPTIRIAQLHQLLLNGSQLQSTILEATSIDEIYETLSVHVNAYWEQHYRFGEVSKKSKKQLGKSTIDLIVINAVIPILFAISNWKNDEAYSEQAINLLESLKAEDNKITRVISNMGFPMKNASNSQGGIELVKNFCNFKRCLQCPIGHEILNLSIK